MLSRAGTTVSLTLPATVGNFGPGFDVASLALAGHGDRLELRPADEDRIRCSGPGADGLPRAWAANVAGRCLDLLREATGVDERYEVSLTKPRPAGSGLGSSASSSAGAALAFHALNPKAGLTAADLVRAAGQAEACAGGAHFDDVAAVVTGGFALVDGSDELVVNRVDPPQDLVLAVAVPSLVKRTRQMRAVLPETVRRADAVGNLAALGRMVDAMHRGDVAGIGACLRDRLASVHRTRDLAFYEPARHAAIDAGAYGAVLSGSGPSIVAVLDDEGAARRAAESMVSTIRDHEVPADPLVAYPLHEEPYDVATLR